VTRHSYVVEDRILVGRFQQHLGHDKYHDLKICRPSELAFCFHVTRIYFKHCCENLNGAQIGVIVFLWSMSI